MANIVAIVSDERVRRQLEQFVGELKKEDTNLATYSSAKQFESVYLSAKPPKKGKQKEEEALAAQAFDEIHVIIFAIDSIGDKVPHWTTSVLKRTKEKGLWPENNRTRFIVLKYEDDNISKLDVLLPELDDLIYLPLDRLIFLQKLEIILNLPKKVKGTFLFSQEIHQDIEISKPVTLEKVSDVGFAVRNPLPLKSGTRAKFYIQLPGTKETIRFFAKALHSTHHPELPQQYLVYFSFFGLRKKETSTIRQWLSTHREYKALLSEDRQMFKYDEGSLFNGEAEAKINNLVIIDPSEEQSANIATQVQAELGQCQITIESSYTFFVHKYLMGAAATNENPPKATREEDIPEGLLQLKISLEKRTLAETSFAPDDKEQFFGHLAKDIFALGSGAWWAIFKSEENDMVLDESIEMLKGKQGRSKVILARSPGGESFAVKIKFTPDTNPDFFLAEITAVSAKEIADRLGTVAKLTSLDALLIDVAFIPPDFNAWMEYLRNTAHAKGLIKRPEDLKVLLMSDREDRLERTWLDSPNVIGLLIKPLDTRQLLYLLSEATHSKYCVFNFHNIGWVNTLTPVHMSKEIALESVSEFGATLQSTAPFRPGSFFFLRKLIFDSAPNQRLAARVYFCEPHPTEKALFQVSVIYYGINSGFLKIARTWIREAYTRAKSQGGS